MGILQKFSLENRTAIITGSGRGLGFEIASAFAEAGAHVWLTGRNAETLEQAVDTLRKAGGKADYAAFDIADTAAGSALVRRIMDEFGHLDILVNNVGARDRRPLAEFSDEDVLELIRTDLTSSISLSRDAAEAMNTNGYGRIITITSILAISSGRGMRSIPSPNRGSPA